MANQFVIAGRSILRWNIASTTLCWSVAVRSSRCVTALSTGARGPDGSCSRVPAGTAGTARLAREASAGSAVLTGRGARTRADNHRLARRSCGLCCRAVAVGRQRGGAARVAWLVQTISRRGSAARLTALSPSCGKRLSDTSLDERGLIKCPLLLTLRTQVGHLPTSEKCHDRM
jgi:hypothetical protein